MNEFNAQKIIDEHGGKCKTRDDRDAVIYAVYPNQQYGIHGAICDSHGEWQSETWTPAGDFHIPQGEVTADLIMPRTVVVEWWQNVYASDVSSVRASSYAEALQYLGGDKNACTIHLTVYSDKTVESEVVA